MQRVITPEKTDRIFSEVIQVIYSSFPISWPSSQPLAQTVFEISCWQFWNAKIFKGPLLRKQVAQRATIAHLSPKCQVNLPQNLMQSFPHPNDATHKIWSRLTNWLQRYSSSKVWNFHHSRASNSEMSGLIRPKIELDWAFMPVLLTSNFDDGSIKNEQASMETPFSHYKSKRNFLDAQGKLTL